MGKLIKRVSVWLVLSLMLVVNFSATAFAVAFSLQFSNYDFLDDSRVLDMQVDSIGDIHVIYTQFVAGPNQDLKYIKWDNVGGSWGSAESIKSSIGSPVNIQVYGDIALDSSDVPALAWVEDDGSAPSLYYEKRNTSSWSASTVTVDSTLEGNRGKPSLDFYKVDGAGDEDEDIASIVACGWGIKLLVEWVADSTADSPSFGLPGDIDSNNNECNGADHFISDTDLNFVVTSPFGSGGDAVARAYYKNAGGAWNLDDSDIFGTLTTVDSETNHVQLAHYDDNGGVVAVALDDEDNVTGVDTLYISERDGGTWQPKKVAASADDIGRAGYGITLNSSNTDEVHVFYSDVAGDKWMYAFTENYGTNWTNTTVESSVGFASHGGNYRGSIFADTDYTTGSPSQTNTLVAIASHQFASIDDTMSHFEFYNETGGGGVPEFSTYVYALTLMIIFGLVYRKMEPSGVFVRH